MARQQLLYEAAKATPPTLANALPRPRLLASLAAATAPARWFSAPSGSGKSTVAAQYAKQTTRPLLWYRLDERDDDPAFFHAAFGRACAQQLPVGPARLPQFAEIDQQADSDIAPRFMAALSAALDGETPPALIVFDDTHKPRSLRLQRTLAAFALGAGPGIELLFVGEEPPPLALFDAIAARRLAVCGDLDLRFDADECAGIARTLRLSQVDPQALAALTGGHAGAVVIACELLRAAPTPARQAALASQLHAYLLENLVARLTDAQRDLLLATCVLPQITVALATALAGRDVDADLEAAADRGLLIRHPVDGGNVYEMHGLVRAGLRGIAAQSIGAARLAALATQACDLLAAEGLIEDAFDTAVTFALTGRAGALLPALAEHHARMQQPQSLLRAIERVPADEVSRRPIVSLLAGHALLGIDEAQATAAFTRAFAAYEALGDRAGMALAAASQLIAFNLKCAELRAVSTWLGRFHQSKDAARDGALALPWQGILQLGVLAEANMGEADATTAAERRAALDTLFALVTQRDAWLSADQQIAAATLAILEASVQRSWDFAQRIGELTLPLARDADVSALRRGRWWQTLGLQHCYAGDLAGAQTCLSRLEELIDEAGASQLRFEAVELGIEIAMRDGRLDDAEAALSRLNEAAALQVDLATAGLLAARVHLLRRRPSAALASIELSLASLRGAGLPRAYLRVHDTEYAYVLLANERAAEAAAIAAASAASLTDVQYEGAQALAECFGFLAGGLRDARQLRRGLGLARKAGFFTLMRRVPEPLARLCNAALAQGIETDFAFEVIRRQGLKPPANACRDWPWPVRVDMLGGFALEIDGLPYRPQRKAQDRPLDLLKLIALSESGAGGRLSKQRAALLLWPDADDANALKSLDMALMRLRRLLGRDEAVIMADSRLLLAPDLVWVDLRSVEASLAALREPGGPTPAASERLLTLYRGHLLEGDDESPWLLGARRALWSAVTAAVLEACAHPALALSVDADCVPRLLQQLLALDDSAEDVARALMRWHYERREYAQALRVYAACRSSLARTLGVPPSAPTERLRAQVLDATEPGPVAHAGR
jgi:ATP/maltotriose-dependent transcriptional regulator MalT/DNA-binding SARP family transcriptional activator